jgi:hypothetical protein
MNTGGNDNDGGGSNTASPIKPENNDNQQQPQGSNPNDNNIIPNTGQGIDEHTGQPKAEPTMPTAPTDLPKCDGSKQDCITRNGDMCKAGEGGEKCECAPDNSDCSKNPNVNPNVDPLVKNPILPACLIPSLCHSPSIPDKGCAFHPDSPKCAPDSQGNCPPGFSHNVHGNCFPPGKCPSGFSRHNDDETGKCFSNKSPHHGGSNTKVIVVHKTVHHTKVIHKSDLHSIATVFVPGIGLVEPFNCKLNADKGKIGCEFIVVKVIN